MSESRASIDAPDDPGKSDTRAIQKIVLPGQDCEGVYVLSTLVKRTYDILPGKPCQRAQKDTALIAGDTYYRDPLNSTVKYESDFVPYKIATDVVVNGTAYAPQGQSVATLMVSLRIGDAYKELILIGDRMAGYISKRSAPIFTDPLPFDKMELRYERAYGGVDVFSDPKVACIYPRNHLGRGFAVRNTPRSVDKLLLPNIEDPKDRLTPERLCPGHFKYWEKQPMPQGFSWVLKSWKPRAGFAGVMPADHSAEQDLREVYSQLISPTQLPLFDQTKLPGMDFRFFNGASQELALPFLSGEEVVELVNMSPEGTLSFQLPGERPKIGIDIGEGTQQPYTVLHTVQIRLEERQVDLIWRGAVPYPGPDWLPKMKKMHVTVS